MELIDTHAHLSFDEITGDVDAVIARSKAAGVTGWIAVGLSPEHNKKVVALAERFENMYAAVGIHPQCVNETVDEDLVELKNLANSADVVALGETGLDFHYVTPKENEQKELFRAQLKIAEQLNLPVIVHCRSAFEDTIEILDEFTGELKNVVFHCFEGTDEQAKVVLDKGFHISFTGIVTFKNAQARRDAAKIVPVERLMVETDCPYISPEPMRKQQINEPALMVHTARLLAELKGMNLETFAKAVTQTTRKFFNLP